MKQKFLKYDQYGAYHWKKITPSLKYYDASLSGRYLKALELTRNLKPMNIIDIGCGDGCLTTLFAKQFPRSMITGIDTSDKAIDFARKITKGFGNLTFINGSLYDIDPESRFDLIICAEVIEHLDDYKTFIERCHTIINSNGYMVITTPARIHELPLDPFHVHEFYPGELKSLLSQHGFIILEHHLSHPLSVGEKYKRTFSPLGIGRIRFNKYIINFCTIILKRNPFIRIRANHYSIFEIQSILVRKK